MKTALLGLGLVACLVMAMPARAATTTTPTTTSTAPSSATKVTLGFNAKKSVFSLNVTGVQSVKYTIEYTRAAGGNKFAQEGLRGGGKARANGVYTASAYAGTQSSKYYIPHNVKSGIVKVTAKKKNGSTYSWNKTFTVTAGKLILK